MDSGAALLLTRELARKAEDHLRSRDEVMERLVTRHGPCDIPDRKFRPFQTLAKSVISQQLSVKAAATIEGRVRQAIGGAMGPKRFLAVDLEILRSAGLSRAKARCLIELSRRVSSGQLDFVSLQHLAEDEAISALTELPGIGPWTAEMFLIFGLKRPNVLSLADAGLQRAVRMLYGTSDIESVGDRWQPYRSVASWFLWRHLDGG